MNKLNAARLLMLLTIGVITAFQVYWLHKLYREEYDSVKRTTDIIFKETIYQLQVNRIAVDSLFQNLPATDIFSKDMIRIMRVEKDSLPKKGNMFISVTKSFKEASTESLKADTQRKIFIRSTGDPNTVAKDLKFNFGLKDSLPIGSLDSAFRKNLKKAALELDYHLIRTDREGPDTCSGDFCTARIPVGIFGQNAYKASFVAPTSYLFKQITTQAVLSFLVVVLTIVSFIFIYRNLMQHKKLAEIKNEFIGNITHELKTPIATVTVAIEAMKNFNALTSPERTAEYLDIAGNELQRLSLLVDKVLKLSMFEQEQVELKFEHLDVRKLVDEILASMRLQFEKHHAQVNVFTDQQELNLTGDRLHLISMLYNLLDNSLKYSGENPKIEIGLSDINDKVRITIADNGIGISSEYKEKIFDKFFRVPSGNRHNVKGYGLGLSYVAHIVSKHGGVIDVDSTPGAGTTFTIDLPKQQHEKS